LESAGALALPEVARDAFLEQVIAAAENQPSAHVEHHDRTNRSLLNRHRTSIARVLTIGGNNMYAARLSLESGVKRFGFQVEPTFMAGAWRSNDIHVDTAVVMLG